MTRHQWLLLVALLIVILLLALPVLTYPLGRDQGEFATIGQGLLNGKTPYTELWNPKPPAVFYVYAAAIALFGQSSVALRALDFLLVPLVSAALAWIGWRLANFRVGFFAALLSAVFYLTESFWTLTQNDGLVLLPMVLALVCAIKAADSADWRGVLWAFGAGTLTAYSVWFKYPFGVFGGVVLLLIVLPPLTPYPPHLAQGDESGTTSSLIKGKGEGFRLAGVSAFALGVLLVMGGGILALQTMGAWDALVESAAVTSQYTALTFNWLDFRELMKTALSFRWHQWGLLFVLAALWFATRHVGERRGQAWWIVILWLLAALAIMLVQAKGYDYHWLPMLPPLALLGADTLDRLITLAGRRGWVRRSEIPVTVIVTLIFLAVLYQTIWPPAWNYLSRREDQMGYYSRFQAGEFVANESLAVAAFLRERVTPGDSLFIWGFRPEVYYMSQLNPATRFIFQFPLVGSWYPPEWRIENVDILWAALPPYALVLQVDYMPWVTGSDEDSNTLLQEYNELRDWLAFNYELDTQIGNFFIWRRKT